jgi:DNA-binding transcriptional ArsR family regulator
MNTSLFNSLGEPSRFQIVELLKWGPLTVSEIGERLELRQPQVSKHLRVLL